MTWRIKRHTLLLNASLLLNPCFSTEGRDAQKCHKHKKKQAILPIDETQILNKAFPQTSIILHSKIKFNTDYTSINKKIA